jgi:hypothetical protein
MRKWIIGVMLLMLAAGLYWRLRPKAPVLAEAYAGDSSVTVWNTTAQVRQNVADLHWGDPVQVLAHNGAQDQVRTRQGVVGWVDSHSLLDEEVWQKEKHLASEVHGLPLQAAGHTKVYSNIRIEPGRDAQRVSQFPGNVPVAIFARKTAPAPQEPSAGEAAAPDKIEEWLLVYGPSPKSAAAEGATPDVADSTALSSTAEETDLAMGSAEPINTGERQAVPPVAGWVLARFIEFDLPETVRDYATSSGVRPIAWFVLNRVPDPSGLKPQFLVAGSKGAEGQSCDFNMLRVYTWDGAHHRYETAYVESDLCGFLPVHIGKQALTGDPEFHFKGVSRDGTTEDWLYRMKQTTVRRVREGDPLRKSRH